MEKIYIQIDDKKIEATGEVLEQIITDRKNAEALKAAEEAAIEAKNIKRKAVLDRLGLTEDEITSLLA